MTEARTYPAGVSSWIDVEVNDLDAAQSFYGGLFGWTFDTATPPDAPFKYTIAQLAGQDVAAIGGPAEPSGEPATERPTWNTYFAVDDADAAAAKVTRLGGTVVQAPTAAGEGGRSVICTDPAGIGFRLWEAKRRLGVQLTNTPGAWNFSDLHIGEPDDVLPFYVDLFGWEIAELGFATLIRQPGYGDHLASTVDPDIYERQSGDLVPPGFADAVGWVARQIQPGAEQQWHVSFTVADRDEIASAAERLGGTVVGTTESDWTREALIRDPEGAEFTASQFTPPTG